MKSDAEASLGRVTEIRSGNAKVIPLAYPLVKLLQDLICEGPLPMHRQGTGSGEVTRQGAKIL
ncbi:hypothetical protein CATRI_11285 [Corynebacterium atrinae]|nr:hypothetical protein CATRI_11285 [Corynebacterium atrinae]